MSTSKHLNRICVIAAAVALLVSIMFMGSGIRVQAAVMGYEDRLFDTSRVHTIDILIDDWDSFLSTAQSEEYTVCDVVIDGERFSTVGVRGKGNISLSTVASMDSDRYSFKLEFDQYDSGKSYYGLDKLSLNNLIQDNTMMKDYLTYRMMNEFGVAAPLCSYVYITVNGEDWGLYLAVEAVEESFLLRNFGMDCGELYKPDSTDLGGGRGDGKDFNMEDFSGNAESSAAMSGGQMMPGMNGSNTPPEMPEGFDPSQMGSAPGEQPTRPDGFDPSQMGGMMPGNMGGGIVSGGTTLQYIDDQVSSYSVIFENAKTDVTAADQQRLISSLKVLSQGEDPTSVLDVDSVIRYFVVHNYVVNADSYTGSMVHNYYLYEDNGKLSMIPWDYNLAFGTFQGGSASDMVSDDIDAPLSVTGSGRPMIDWVWQNAEYTELYHTRFQEFLESVDPAAIIAQTQALISPYVQQDPTKFCTYEEFEKGVQTLTAFCRLRDQSITDQLAGGDGAVDASAITLSDMGTMNHGMGGNSQPGTQRPNQGGFTDRTPAATAQSGGQWILPVLTVLVLAAGLFFAFKFKR